jgi:hypothetical protein
MKELQDINSKEVILISNEALIASTCIEQGLTALRKASFTNKKKYYQSFFMLSIGIERILKLTYVIKCTVNNNCLPPNDSLKSFGHNLLSLFENITQEVRPNENFLLKDHNQIHSKIINLLNEFGKSSRYYNLDSLNGQGDQKDPLAKWYSIQLLILGRHLKNLNNIPDSVISKINSFSLIHIYNENNTLISDAKTLTENIDNSNILKEYSVLYVYQLLDYIITILLDLNEAKRMLPELRDYFFLFRNPSYMTNTRIRNKKDWSKI